MSLRPAFNLVWLPAAGCGGCSQSLLSEPDWLGTLKAHGLNLRWHPGLSIDPQPQVEAMFDDFEQGRERLDVLLVEGAISGAAFRDCRADFEPAPAVNATARLQSLAAVAQDVVAVGNCSAFGGATAAGANPSEAMGLQMNESRRGGLLGAGFRARSGRPVINLAGCPTHPGWVLDTLALLAGGELPAAALDELQRPRFYTDHLVHHGCPRNEFYEYKASAEKPSDLGCLMEHMGCKGTQAHADCNTRPWNGNGSCLRGGYPCVACTEPGFEDAGHALLRTPKLGGIPTGLPSDMPRAWFVALAALSKSATPRRLRENATSDHPVIVPLRRRDRAR